MRMRLATQDDLPALMALVRRVVPLMLAAGNRQWDEGYPNRSVFERDIVLEQLWVAETENGIAGVADLTMDQEPEYAQANWDMSAKALVVHRLAVDTAFRGEGVASALMQKAEEVAVVRDFAVVRVDTNTENAATQRLFPKLGYRPAGEIGLGMRPGLRFFCYEKTITK